MIRMRLAGVALAAVFAVAAGTATASGAATATVHCLRAPVMELHPDDRYVVVLSTGTADTALAGWGEVDPRRTERRLRRRPVYGQVAEVARAGGPAGAGVPAGRAVLVPWEESCDRHPIRWWRSFAWLRPGTPDAVVGRLRRPEDWADGVPTIDVFRPELMRESGILPGAVRWTATPGELFEFYATIPTESRLRADPWGSMEAMWAWLVANAHVRLDHPIRYAARGIHDAANHASVRAAPSPLAGTYRFEVSRTGGPTHTLYMRTGRVAMQALWVDDTTRVVPPAVAPGYKLRASFRLSESGLPSPHPGPPAGRGRTPPDDELEVLLPETQAADGSRRFRAHLGLWNVTHSMFPDDPELRQWIGDWSRRKTSNMQVDNPPGEIVLRPDGGVELSEVLELAPGQVVTIRGVRISEVAVETPPDR